MTDRRIPDGIVRGRNARPSIRPRLRPTISAHTILSTAALRCSGARGTVRLSHARVVVIAVSLVAGISFTAGSRGAWSRVSAHDSTLAVAADKDADERGRPAPELELVDVRGRPVRLAALRGKVVIVNLWATWCPPCVMEVPTFKKLHATYRDRGLEIIAISLDEDEREVKTFIREHALPYTVILGDEQIAEKFGALTGLPMTFFIDRKGRIRAEHAGFMDEEDFVREVERLLSEP